MYAGCLALCHKYIIGTQHVAGMKVMRVTVASELGPDTDSATSTGGAAPFPFGAPKAGAPGRADA